MIAERYLEFAAAAVAAAKSMQITKGVRKVIAEAGTSVPIHHISDLGTVTCHLSNKINQSKELT